MDNIGQHGIGNEAFDKKENIDDNNGNTCEGDGGEQQEARMTIVKVHTMKEKVIGKRAPRNKKKAAEDDKVMTEEFREREPSGATKLAAVVKFFFSNAGLMYGCVAYAVWGANMYIAMELPGEEGRYEEKRKVAIQIEDNMEYLADSLWLHMKDEEFNKLELQERMKDFENKTKNKLKKLVEQLVTAADTNGYDGKVEGWDYDWSFTSALLFTVTIMTTVGYGHISPQTDGAKIFTIFYSLLGIPLLVVFMTKVGDFYANVLKWGYSRLCCRVCRNVRRKTENEHIARHRQVQINDDVVGQESWMPSDEIMIPITINLVVLVGFQAFGMALFSSWEEWDWVSSAYFCFITMTTIGFGDMVPDKSFVVNKGSWWEYSKTIFSISYLIIGMVVLSMCFSLMGEMAELKARSVAEKMGYAKTEVALDVVTIKTRKTWNGSYFGDIQNEEDIDDESQQDDENDDNDDKDDNGDNDAQFDSTVDIPGQVMDADSLGIFDEVSSDEEDGSLFGQYLSSDEEEDHIA